MSKAAGVIGVSATAAAASVGGVYLSRMSSFDSSLPQDIQKFEEHGQEEGCVVDLFPDLKNMNASDSSADSKLDNQVLGGDDKSNAKGCLVVNWNKEIFGQGKDEKWKGGFRFLWAIKNEKNNKGLIIFADAQVVQGGKVKWNGNTYVLEKKDANEWKVSKKISIANGGKEVEVNGKFPKAKQVKPPYWGFLSEPSGDISKFCDNGSCKESEKNPDKNFEGYWTWDGDDKSNEKIGDWMENLETWWKETFGEDKGKIKDVLQDVKGKWTDRVWYGVDKFEAKEN